MSNKRTGTHFYKDQRSEADEVRDLLNQFNQAAPPRKPHRGGNHVLTQDSIKTPKHQ